VGDFRVVVTASDTADMIAAIRARASDVGPALVGPVAEILRSSFQAQFLTAGAYGGNPWEPLQPASLRRRKGASGVVLDLTGEMRSALTEPDAPGSVAELGGDGMSLLFGTDLDRAAWHQHGTRYMPARELLPDPWPPEDIDAIASVIADFIGGAE